MPAPQDVQNIAPGYEGPNYENRAEDPAIAKRVVTELLPKLTKIRADKQGLHREWSYCFDVWNQTHRVRLYEGASDLYIPAARNIVETFVAQIKNGSFPSTRRYWIEPVNPQQPGASPAAVGKLFEHDVVQAEVDTKIEGVIRDALTYGTAIVKFPWIVRQQSVWRRKPLIPPELVAIAPQLAGRTQLVKEKVRTYNGPGFVTVDPFRFYVHPITCTSLDEAQIIFEDLDTSYSHLQAMEEAGVYFGVKRVKEAGQRPRAMTDSERNQRLSRYGLTVDGTRQSQANGINYGDQFILTEVWLNWDIDGTGVEEPCKIVCVGDIVLEVRCNPFLSQRPPYRAWKLIQFPDLFFGQGLITGMKHQSYAINALVNQGIDAAVYQTNPMVIINAQALPQGMGSFRMGHRSVLYINGEPEKNVHFVEIPDTSKEAFQTVQLLIQGLRDMNLAPDVVQGRMAGGDTTATEATIVGSNAAAGVDNMIRSLQSQILTPMMKDWYLLNQQFLDEQVWLKTSGEDKQAGLTADDLVGDYRQMWLVNTQVKDEVGQLQDQMMISQMQAQQDQGNGMPGMAAGPMAPQTPAEMGGGNLAGGAVNPSVAQAIPGQS